MTALFKLSGFGWWVGAPIPIPAKISFSLRIGRGGWFTRMWVVQTHRGPPLFKVLIRRDCVVSLSMMLVNRTWELNP